MDVASNQTAPVKRKSTWEHQKELIEATGGIVRVKVKSSG
jgi:hypothetical protein